MSYLGYLDFRDNNLLQRAGRLWAHARRVRMDYSAQPRSQRPWLDRFRKW
jgi:hypothetical protein